MVSARGSVGGVLAVILILVVGWAGSTWYLGYTINDRLDQEVDRIADLPYVNNVVYEKTKGFFSTDFFLAVHFSEDQVKSGFGDKSTEGFPPLGLSSTIQHGPILGLSSERIVSTAKAEIHEIVFLGMIIPVSNGSAVAGFLEDTISGHLVVDNHGEAFSGDFPATEAIENLSLWFEGDPDGWTLDLSIGSWRWLHEALGLDRIEKEDADGGMEAIEASLDYKNISAAAGPVLSLSVNVAKWYDGEGGARRGVAPNQLELEQAQIRVLGRGHGLNWDGVWDWNIIGSASSVLFREGDETFETGATTMEAEVFTDGGYSNIEVSWLYKDLDIALLDLLDFQGRIAIGQIPPRTLIEVRDTVRDLRSDPLGFYDGPEGYAIATREAVEAVFGDVVGGGLPISGDVRGRTSNGEWGMRGEARLDVTELLSQPYPFLVLFWPDRDLRLVFEFDDELLDALWGRELKIEHLEEFGISEQPEGYTLRLRANNGRMFLGRRDVTDVYKSWIEWVFMDSEAAHQ